MSTQRKVDNHTGTEIKSHEWDGIEELDTPMPRWWLGIFYATIVWAVIYVILMPAIPAPPGMQGYTKGVLKKSDRAEVAAEVAEKQAERAVQGQRLIGANLATIENDPDLLRFANAQGQFLFENNCETCHGQSGQGFIGYPNLNDDIWLWGGTYEDIKTTIAHGIRSSEDEDTRIGEMSAYGKLGQLSSEEISAVVQHVLKISGQEFDATREPMGATIFTDTCASCHMENGRGDPSQGAPDLTDNYWLYGGDEATLYQSVYNGRAGMMPNWNERLSEDQIDALAFYVHSLGGGE